MLNLVTDAIPGMIAYVDLDLRYAFSNQAYAQMFARPVEEVVGRTMPEVLGEAIFAVAEPRVKRALLGATVDFKTEIKSPDGVLRNFEVRYVPDRDDRQRVRGLVIVAHDVTKSQRTQLELSLKSDAIENSLAGFDIVDETGKFIYVNPAYVKMWGYDSTADILGSSPVDHCVDPAVPRKIITALKEKGECDIEFLARRKDGSTFDVRMMAFLARDAEGREIYPTTSVDITEQKKGESRSRQIIETIPQGIWRTNPDGSADYFSERFYELVGYSAEEFLGWGWSKVIHAEDQERVLREWQAARAARAPVSVDFRVRDKAGHYRWFLSLGNPFFDDRGELVKYYGTWTDIHDRVVARQSLEESQRRFQTLIEVIPQLVWTCLADGQCDYLSKQWVDFTGVAELEQLGLRWLDRVIHPDDRERTREHWLGAVKGLHAYDIEYRIRRHDGEYIWFQTRGTPLRNREGTITHWFGTCTDIHELKVAQDRIETYAEELHAAKDEAERANELKSAFLANMSHEIRTPLGAMIGFADLLRDPGLSGVERSNYIDILSRNGESLSVIINDILDLSKVEAGHLTLEFSDMSPDAIAADVVSLLRVKAKEKDLSLICSMEESTPLTITADPIRVRQVLMNLVSNAIKFTQFGSVTVRSFGCKTDDGREAACFEIKDTGIGIPEEQAQRIFEMFVQADGTMTRRFGGTGLGLALARRLARAMGGDVSITQSAPGKGSTFLFKVEDQPSRRNTISTVHRERPSIPGEMPENILQGKRVLVVDDSPDNQQLIWHYLTKQGAIVDSADNGLIGYRMAMAGDFDIVLMDIQMPEMDGYTATHKLRSAGYKKPVIALTAHAMADVRQKSINVGCTDHLTKPINPGELIRTIACHT